MSTPKMSTVRAFIRKWQKLARVGKVHTTLDFHSCAQLHAVDSSDSDEEAAPSVPEGFEVVYIGKSKRRFVINGRHLKHPLFKALQERSSECGVDQSQGPTLGCEVVLFEHLLWMLDSNDPAISQSDSVHELAELYMPSDGAALSNALESEGEG